MRRTLFASSGILLICFSWMIFNAFTTPVSEEYGKASFYADSFQGRKTSNGEKYDKTELTCAHKSLPYGAKVRVTRLDNKKSVIVRVNDRGPYKEGYIVSLSRRAAEVIDLDRAGSAGVRVEVVPDTDATATAGGATASSSKAAAAAERASSTASSKSASSTRATAAALRPAQYSTADTRTTTTTTTAKGAASAANTKDTKLYQVDMQSSAKVGYGLQLSTLYDADNVLPIVTKLQQQWPGKVLVSVERDNANDLSAYRVIIGPYADEKSAAAQQKVATRRGYKQSFVVDLTEI